MPLVAPLKDGQFVNSTSSTSIANANKDTNKSGMDSNAFLTLLVAEMQNQDPLEPTSNTEWVSQYATFTQVSEIQNIGQNMQSMKAQDLVGEYVIMKVTNEQNGESDYVSGQVDYVVYEEGKAFLSIDGKMYSVDDLDTVASREYMDAYNLAADIVKDSKELPNIDALTSSYKKLVNNLYDKVDGMTAYQEKFVDPDLITLIKTYKTRMDMIVKAEEAVKNATSENKAKEDNTDGQTIVNNTTNVTNIYNTEANTDTNKANENSENKEVDASEENTSVLPEEKVEETENSESSNNESASDEELAKNAAENGTKNE